MIDLRSDTVTKPSPEMRRAMFEAEVGDDVYAEDPTINRLEQRSAEISGREAALFVPSGTMGNEIAIKLHTTHGQEVICEERSHVFTSEMAMNGRNFTNSRYIMKKAPSEPTNSATSHIVGIYSPQFAGRKS